MQPLLHLVLKHRWIPLAILLAAFAVLLLTGGLDAVSFEEVSRRYAEVRALVDRNETTALAIFMLIYASLLSTVVFPAAFVCTILGGVFFGPVTGALASVIAATTGATIAFLAARHAMAQTIARRAGPRLLRLRDGLRRDGTAYLVALRLTPLVPFWLVTLSAAIAGLHVRQFVVGTLVGIVPAAFVFAGLGSSVARTLALGGEVPIERLALSPSLLLPLAGLALLSFVAIAVRTAPRRRA